MAQNHVITRWYAYACQVARTPDDILKNVLSMSKQTRCTMRALARVHPFVGQTIDELRAPLVVCRRIAHAPGAAEQWSRAEQELAQLVESRAKADPTRAARELLALEELRAVPAEHRTRPQPSRISTRPR